MRDDRERLLDIQDAITGIEKYAARGREAFDQDELIQIWVVHHLQIIGEASRALSDAFKQEYSDWPWTQIVGMRNVLVHRYFEIDREIVWAAVENHLPDLKAKLKSALKTRKKSATPPRQATKTKSLPRQKKRKK